MSRSQPRSGSTTSKKGKPPKVPIPRADPSNAVFPHQYRGLQVVDQVAAGLRHFLQRLSRHRRVLWRGNQHLEPRRGQQRLKELPSPPWTPGGAQRRAGMSRDSQELVANVPRQKHLGPLTPPPFQSLMARSVEYRAFDSRVKQDVGVENQHSVGVQHLVELPTVGNVHQRRTTTVPPWQWRQRPVVVVRGHSSFPCLAVRHIRHKATTPARPSWKSTGSTSARSSRSPNPSSSAPNGPASSSPAPTCCAAR